MKYSGTNDALDHKVKVFVATCKTVNLPESKYYKAIRLILKEATLDYFFEYNEITTFNGIVASIYKAFEGLDFKRL